MIRLFEPDLVPLCWECGDPLDDDFVASVRPGYWAHTPCDLDAACETAAVAEQSCSVIGRPVEGPYSARFPSSPLGETSRRALPAGHGSRHGSSRHEAVVEERPPPG